MNEFEHETTDRLMRIETRLAQLMLFCGAEIHRANEQNGLLRKINDLLDEPETYDAAAH